MTSWLQFREHAPSSPATSEGKTALLTAQETQTEAHLCAGWPRLVSATEGQLRGKTNS